MNFRSQGQARLAIDAIVEPPIQAPSLPAVRPHQTPTPARELYASTAIGSSVPTTRMAFRSSASPVCSLIGSTRGGDVRLELPTKHHEVAVAVCQGSLSRWSGPTPVAPFQHWNKRYWATHDGRPAFAETAIRTMLSAAGFNARWVTPTSRGFALHLEPVVGAVEPFESRETAFLLAVRDEVMRRAEGLSAAGDESKWRAGCWDVVGFRGDEVVFVEAKQRAASWSDAIRPSQRLWLEVALDMGVLLESFAVFDWTLT